MLPTIPVKIITELHCIDKSKGFYDSDALSQRGKFDIVDAQTNPSEIGTVMTPDEMNFHRLAQVTSFNQMMPIVKSIVNRPDLQLTVYMTTFDSIHVAGLDSETKKRHYFIIRYRAIIKDHAALLVNVYAEDQLLTSGFVARNEPFASMEDMEAYLKGKVMEAGVETSSALEAATQALKAGLNKKEWVKSTVDNMTVEIYHQ